MSANMHGLLHLPGVAKKLGPLWAHSCFPFEAANGVLLKLFHGSQSTEKQVSLICNICCSYCCMLVDLQVVRYINMLQKLPVLARSLPTDSHEMQFIQDLASKKHSNR